MEEKEGERDGGYRIKNFRFTFIHISVQSYATLLIYFEKICTGDVSRGL